MGGDRAGLVHRAGFVERGDGFEALAARTDHYRAGGAGKEPRP
ncbi:hypothetical protein [Streptomyces soliscabiei]|nr:hypothetical protein [Streptomyces sp. NY05-11A]MDX2677700.1 hypothetical protein [Streptomyces sp. NY05-11A]